MSEPCFRCGARADVDCGHRPVDPDWKPYQSKADRNRSQGFGGGRFKVDPDRYKPPRGEGSGWNFKRRKGPK